MTEQADLRQLIVRTMLIRCSYAFIVYPVLDAKSTVQLALAGFGREVITHSLSLG